MNTRIKTSETAIDRKKIKILTIEPKIRSDADISESFLSRCRVLMSIMKKMKATAKLLINREVIP